MMEYRMKTHWKTIWKHDNGTVLLEYVLLNMVLFILAGTIFFFDNATKNYGVTLWGFEEQLTKQFQRLNAVTASPVP